MTIKAYVLDALQKFWNKLKTTYVTDCVTDDDNLALAASQGKVLHDSILTLEDLTSVTHQNITFLGFTATIYKCGNVAQLAYFGQPTVGLPSNAETTACTLPSGYRPAVRIAQDLFTSSSSKMQIVVNTNGIVGIYNFGTAFNANTGWIRGNVVFILA